ncbi:hypothetical protein IW140_005880 [Coemansia sp. RSA 1813]|nr:hypothetical protein EV178_005315 [Coemansia sp. RSA 1646]KAJ1766102.1 hypothetical protein LPJ74_006045 [Coemansia sp. RSA 1843]KAJ2086182.1 hypothetical protein IW138_005854 [Coemansia sp. RSA 986]KAJ2210913.1 hypothetical protein EV179_005902 [Coemansia sp. RSA 487]KAJ2564062.1 hypothetical protein IW140_005880 [Coemansia sp. RSA 1813]
MDKVALITGCSEGGIGHSLALEFASEGYRVYATALRMCEFSKYLLEKDAVTPLVLDITKPDSIKQTIQRVLGEASYIDILINNAGIGCIGPAIELDTDLFKSVLTTNVVGTMSMCQAVAPSMIDRRQGTIVNVGSVTGFLATPWSAQYTASKAAVHAFSDSLRLELAPFGVHVVVLAPGGIVSNLGATIDPKLAPDSKYKKAESEIIERAKLSDPDKAMPADEFAKAVVPRILVQAPSAYISYGKSTSLVQMVYYFPTWLKDYILARMFGTNKLKPSTVKI